MITEAQAYAALPKTGFLKDYVDYAKDRVPSNLAYHIGTGLSLLTQVAPVNYTGMWGGIQTYPNMFILLVGPSGDGKGVAMKVAESILDRVAPGRRVDRCASANAYIEKFRKQHEG